MCHKVYWIERARRAARGSLGFVTFSERSPFTFGSMGVLLSADHGKKRHVVPDGGRSRVWSSAS